MKFKALKKFHTKSFLDVFTAQSETKGLQIDIGDTVKISIDEQQNGTDLKEPYIHIDIKDNGTYIMALSTFIDKITR